MFIRRSQCEIDALCDGRPAIRPYWDERLRTDRQQRIQVFKRLAGRGLVGFRRSVGSRVAPFLVAKRNGQIRMVLDAREVNLLHRPPPHTALSAPGANASLDFSEAISCDRADKGVVGGSVDLSDSFYLWCCDAMGVDFGFDTPETADTFDVTSIWSPDGLVPVAPGDLLSPVFRGLLLVMEPGALGSSYHRRRDHCAITAVWCVPHGPRQGPAAGAATWQAYRLRLR